VTGRIRGAGVLTATFIASLAVIVSPAAPVQASGPWLDRLNAWRGNAGLLQLGENTTWSQGDYNHSLYMVKDDLVTHYEYPSQPYYSVAGDQAAQNGNIEVRSSTSFTDTQAIDWWMAAPFHALGMMDPRLSSTGFGSYREVKSGWQAGFTLDTLRGNSFSGGTYPVYFPGNQSSEPLTSYQGGEFPDPLQGCPGYGTPTGLPVFVQVGGNVATSVTAHAFTAGGTALAHCVLDSSTPNVGSNLTSRGAAVLIPQQPLVPGTTYTVALTVNGVPYTWSFTVSTDGSLTGLNCTVAVVAPATATTTEFNLSLTGTGCNFNQFDLQVQDTTLNQGWFDLTSVATSNGTATRVADGYPGHSYQFRARTRMGNMISSWSGVGSTAVASTATKSMPFSGLYTLDGWGGVHADESGPLSSSASWPGWSIARTAHSQPGSNAPQSGFVLDGFGGLHPYGASGLSETSGGAGHYWGFDIARDFAFMPDGTGGFVLDGYGGLHPFRVNGATGGLAAQGNSFWNNWDIARRVVIFPDGTGGYVMDAYGGVHPFGINGAPPVSNVVSTSYWPGWQIARDLVLIPANGNHSGYVLDGYGGLHPFHPTSDGSTQPGAVASSYPGFDIVRGVFFLPGSATAGYTLDGYGGLHPFGGAPAITNYPYWPGWDIAKNVWGA
jgi:hypothetical protein